MFHIYACIGVCPHVADPSKESMELQVPCVGGLFETIYCPFKVAHLSLCSGCNESYWLLHIDLLIEHAIQECRFDVHLLDSQSSSTANTSKSRSDSKRATGEK